MRMMIVLAAAVTLAATVAQAQVTGVVTATTATVKFKPDATGANIIYTYSGDQISAADGDNGFGSGGEVAATSKLAPNSVSFQNGNASSGAYTYLTSQTNVDITYTNDGATAVIPQLHSEIVPAGFGVFVSRRCLASLTSCPEQGSGATFQSFSPDKIAPVTTKIAGSSIDFRILNDGVTIYDLTASVDLVTDPATGQNVFVDNIAQAQATLNGFQLETTPGAATEYGFNWQATDLNIGFPGGAALQPDQSATLTYQTTVQTYSRADCISRPDGCLIAYSAFGDPIGGGGGIKPGTSIPGFAMANLMSGEPIADLTFQNFVFAYPTFQNGVLTYQLAAIPEPATWTLALFGAGAIGAALRRRRDIGARGGATPIPA